MNVEFTPRATADLARIGAWSRRVFGPAVAAALETFIRATIARLAVFPESGLRLQQRPNVLVVPLVRYPFKIFYTLDRETVRIVHIRHAARRVWEDDQS
jgi:plasmid stabilization system protein ParE